MARRIQYRAQCYVCKQWFEPGKAWLHLTTTGWKCHCDSCYRKSQAKKESEKL